MRLYGVAHANAFIPPLTMHAAHALAASQGLVPACFPYLQGCLSVSAAGRSGSANYLFDALMIPSGFLLAVVWLLVGVWIRRLGGSRRLAGFIRVSGIIAAVFMIGYAVFLGVETNAGRLLRRLGINGYFFFNMLNQILLSVWVARRSDFPVMLRRAPMLLLLVAVFWAFMSGLEDVLGWNSNRIDNVIEWNFVLFMSLHFWAIGSLWRRTGFQARVSLGQL